MDGYTTDYINLIADNLRDRYDNGFPILKELIQNADDAKARSFIFAYHEGFPDAVHPLLTGPGLWFFNDGEFKSTDARALRSFGINSKAGDASAIGKFGLGMKSIFHLCEALFYLAWDGQELHRKGLNPWKQDDRDAHPEWDKNHPDDWKLLEALATPLMGQSATWFLLWIPLRCKAHLHNARGEDIGAIIDYCPGDNPHQSLNFLSQSSLPVDLAQILTLLKHLERIEHQGKINPFIIQLKADQRLIGDGVAERSGGEVVLRLVDSEQSLRFAGMGHQDHDRDKLFSSLKDRREWPKSRYRDERGHEKPVPDKARPEAAVLFCSGPTSRTRFDLHWAVFLPVDQGSERLQFETGKPGHSLVLHGQFFIDAGRKKPHALENLHDIPASISAESIDDAVLRRTWNQHLAQRVLLPLVIPALEHYVAAIHLSDADSKALTQALADSHWFDRFKSHVCCSDSWFRIMEPGAEPVWKRVNGLDLDRLRPLPSPPKSDAQRPWQIFPRLKRLGLMTYDANAPFLYKSKLGFQWQEAELDDLLGEVAGLFTDGPRMDYLVDFLESYAKPFLQTERLQLRLISLFRAGLLAAGGEARRQHAEKSRRLFEFVEPSRRLALAVDLPDSILQAIWKVETTLLLLPKLEPALIGYANPDDNTLRDWLQVLDHQLDKKLSESNQQAILDASQGLLKGLDGERRGRFLRIHDNLRIIAVRDARTGKYRAVTGAEIRAVRAAGTLFRFTQGTQERERMGLTPLLTAALPDSRIWLVRAESYRDLFPNEDNPPTANDKQALLAAIGRNESGVLGDMRARCELLEQANDPGSDAVARRGLRYLLHGSKEHREFDNAPLWFPGHDQHPAWSKLWGQLHGTALWSRIPPELVDAFAVPRTRWTALGVYEIEARSLADELARTGADIPMPGEFALTDREEILSKVENQYLWQRLSLHTTVTNQLTSADRPQVYLAPADETLHDSLVQEATLIAPSANRIVADQQRRWLKLLDDRARIEIALGTVDPVRYWSTIATSLLKINLAGEINLKRQLVNTAWLPTISGEPVKPQDVIDLAGSLADEAQILVAEHRDQFGLCFTVPADLDNRLQTHAVWSMLREQLFSSGESGLDQLALLLADLPNYHIGLWQRTPETEIVALLAGCPALAGWRLLQKALEESFESDLAWKKLSHGLSEELEPEKLLNVLIWLSEDITNWTTRKQAFDIYLSQLVNHQEFFNSHLPDLQLASRSQRWESSAKLCVDADGADPTWLLDSHQARILGEMIHQPTQSISKVTPHTNSHAKTAFEERVEGTRQTLKKYFQPWISSSIPPPMIGVVIGLLGCRFHSLAKDYLGPFHLDRILSDDFPWSDPGGDRLVKTWMYRKTLNELMAGIQVAVQVLQGDKAEAANLLGNWIQVPLDPKVLGVLAGTVKWEGGYKATIQFRPIDPVRVDDERLATLLRAVAEKLYAEFYNQKQPDLSSLWKRLDRSNQLEIDVACNMILGFLPWYLRQISLEGAMLKEALRNWDTQRLKVEEVKAAGKDESAQRAELHRAERALQCYLLEDNTAQQRILSGVKAKLRQFEYDVSAIPFELFQNADDATVELGEIAAHSGDDQLPLGARRFVIEVGNAALRFIHWGRPVNARGPVEFGGEERGFGRDLEKMLILFESDKEFSQGLTGKFGLGFKSVFLVCNQPRILSDRLALEIVAGILPRSWSDNQNARDALNHYAESLRLPGTLIELPGVTGSQQTKLLERFEKLAGVLCAFSQAIHSVEIVKTTLGEILRQQVAWKPLVVCPGVEYGRLGLASDWGSETGALRVHGKHGSLLIAVGPEGFRNLPDEIPTLWVTAPTKEQARLGFALNGRFSIDAGRTRLPGNDDSNRILARNMGTEIGKALSLLFDRSCADWAIVRQELGLVPHLTAEAFWRGLWVGLTERWLGRQRDNVAELAREFVLALLKRLADRLDSVPNGLTASLQTFTAVHQVYYELPNWLAQPEVVEILATWGRFKAHYLAISLVAPEIGAILKHADLVDLKTIGLIALIAIIDLPQIEYEDADVLGRLWQLTEQQNEWNSKEVRNRLGCLQFRSESGGWTEAGELLTNHDEIDPDEALRYTLAPPNRRLHRNYSVATNQDANPALDFFLVCRERLQAPVELLATWVLDARTDERRLAALVYIADGKLGEDVAERVREQSWLHGGFQNSSLLAGLSSEQRERLQRRLASSEVLKKGYEAVNPDPWSSPPPPPRIDLEKALANIHAWWSTDEGIAQAEDYYAALYPAMEIDLQIDPETGRFDRSSWLILFSLGAFQGMGRTQDVQHRGFIQYCQQKGWWQTFATVDPKEYPQKWMDIIEEYAEGQHDDEQWTQWIAQFPKLYKLRRWMDDYVELFLSINRFDEHFLFQDVLTPRANRHYQGGGIDPPALIRTLKLGGYLVIRELLRHGVIRSPFAIPHAYAPIDRIQRLFDQFNIPIESSQEIYKLLCTHLGEAQATFNGDYDIPLRIVAGDEELQNLLFR